MRSDIHVFTAAKMVMPFLSSTDFFFQNPFFSKFYRTTMRMSNSLDTDQARHYVGPNLGPNCLQKLSANDTRRHIVKGNQEFRYTDNLLHVTSYTIVYKYVAKKTICTF